MTGKTIVITGANGGLGRALAQRFAADGDTILLLGRTLSKVQEVAAAIGERASAVQCDVSSPDSVRAAFASIAETHGPIDVLINNAAIFQPFLIEEATDAQILDAVTINLAGPMFTSRSAIPLMRTGGHIVNLSSESVEVPLPHLLAYESTKAGLERLSRGLRDELADRGIRVTVVRAGQMFGPGMSAEMEPEAAGRFFQAAAKMGFDLAARGATQYDSTTQIFRTIIDSPADLHIGTVTYQSRVAQ
ncbi:SDR family oxidoreductase [Sphingobium tyrosinilyticum]|uniref:SDR family oxidoreductase n=1 Tax=Sphingobium tyrosinilyticum TaxID=2715436 RepID=A0ABV9F1Y6_9SPHN